MNLKYSMRRNLTIIAVVLAVLSALFITTQRGRSRTQPRENKASSARQPAGKKEGMPADKPGTAAPYERKLPGGGQPERHEAVIPVSGVRMQTKLIHKVDVAYPEKVKSTGLSNNVVLNITIDESGAVVKTVAIFGNQVFAEAAAEAVSQWRYEPLFIDGEPSWVSFNVEIFFSANETVSTGVTELEELLVNFVNIITDTPDDASVNAIPVRLFGASRTYNSREYYSITPEMSAPAVRIDKQRLREVVYKGRPNDDRLKDIFVQPIFVSVFINENGGIDGIQHISGAKIPSLESELMNIIVQAPASFSGNAVPCWFMLTINVADFVR